MPGWWAAGISLVGGLIGGSKSASAAKSQANAQNAATNAKYGYDLAKWDMDKDKLLADRQYAIDVIQAKERNEAKSAAFADSSRLAQYNRELQIRNREQTSLNQQYLRSDDIYKRQITLNASSAAAGAEDEIRKLQEIHAEAQFDSQDAYIDSIVAQGKMRSIGSSGRSAAKGVQATLADYGRQMSMLDASLDFAGRNSRSVLEEIARDKTSADLSAYAQKMLHPGTLPMPLVPFKTPMAEFTMPREFGPYDFGPQPVRGAMASPSAAANMAWGSAIQGIAGGVASGIATLQ